MARGFGGKRRPADMAGCAVTLARIVTSEIKDTKETPRQSAKARSGRARAVTLTPVRRKEIACQAAAARWAGA